MTNNINSTKYFSDRQELAVAKALDGRRTPASGASKFFKGDVVTPTCLIECKTQTTEKKSFSIKREWIEKAKEEAFSTGKSHTVIAFNFGGENQGENFYVIEEREMKILLEALSK